VTLGRLRGDGGTAVVEFVLLGVLLLLPIVYAVLTALTVQRSAYALTAATREAGRVFAHEGGGASAYDHAYLAARVAMRDQGLDLEPAELRITCEPVECGTPGGHIQVSIDRQVPLPLLPAFGQNTPSIAVHGRHDEVVDCFASGTAQGGVGLCG